MHSVGTTCTTRPELSEVIELEGYGRPTYNKLMHLTMTRSTFVRVICWLHQYTDNVGCPRSNLAEIFGIRKLESLGYRVALFVWFCISGFDTIQACDGQTNGHTTTAYTALAWRRTVKKYKRSIKSEMIWLLQSQLSHITVSLKCGYKRMSLGQSSARKLNSTQLQCEQLHWNTCVYRTNWLLT